MFHALTGRSRIDGDPPAHRRPRRRRGRVSSLLALASALALGLAMMAVPQSAQAVTNLDGQWAVVHGGTGQLSLKANGTYTSSCRVTPGYADAWCPAPNGTFERNSLGGSYVTFHGYDGTSTSYRFSGNVQSPDTITSVFGSTTYSPLVMKKVAKRGTKFVCTDWSDNASRMKGSPLVYVDQTGTILYATGSHDLLGPAVADVSVTLAEVAPNYSSEACAAGCTQT